MRMSDWSSDVCSSDLPSGNSVMQQALVAVLGPVEVGEQFRGAAVVVGGGHLEAHARAAVAAAHVGPGLRRIEDDVALVRSEEHTSELQSLMRISYAVFCLKKKTTKQRIRHTGR